MDTERLIGTEANRHAVILVNKILKMKNDGNTLDEIVELVMVYLAMNMLEGFNIIVRGGRR